MFSSEIPIAIKGQQFLLLKEKAVFWVNQEALLFADLHAGKASHFRRHGIPLSSDYFLNDLNRIENLIKRYKPKKVMVLGDLFHSDVNIENNFVEQWVKDLNIPFGLILGNHDVHSVSHSKIISDDYYLKDGIYLSHEPADIQEFNIYGHLHPAYAITGKARQHLKLPSFYFGPDFLVLPSFGSTTGGRVYKDLVKQSEIYIISDEGLMKV
jgi:DNA ligase-associated metallophosphoesterase